MFGDIGLAVLAQLSEFTDVVFALTQCIEDFQPQRLRQRAKLIGDAVQSAIVEFLHVNLRAFI